MSSSYFLPLLCTSLVLLALPIVAGLLLGSLVQHGRGRPSEGILAAVLALVLPVLVTLLLLPLKPIVGFWDAALEGLLAGVGVLYASHRWYAGWREIALTTGAVAVSLAVLELGARFLLPPAPGFPASDPHVFLADALLANASLQAWDIGSNEIVCSAVYGERYERKLNPGGDQFNLPGTYRPRPGKRRRVLHVGDSMVYGLEVRPDERFTALLEQLDPNTEHVNAGIRGTAPDAYFAVIQGWVTAHPLNMVVMYLYPDNDYSGLDSPSPCCNFEPILSYEGRRASLRCPTPNPLDLDGIGYRVLRLISPPPYLLRALIPRSRAAADVAAALVANKLDGRVTESMERTLDTIVQTAADELRARGIPLVVVTMPSRAWVEDSHTMPQAAAVNRMLESARKAGVPALDAGLTMRAAFQRGAHPFIGSSETFNGHFNPAGHELMARWLLDALPAPGHSS